MQKFLDECPPKKHLHNPSFYLQLKYLDIKIYWWKNELKTQGLLEIQGIKLDGWSRLQIESRYNKIFKKLVDFYESRDTFEKLLYDSDDRH